MFNKVLIANRGEIALRVARACRELGVETVAVYSSADADSAVVRFADEAVHIGPRRGRAELPPRRRASSAPPSRPAPRPIHPGYGFLSEDPYFPEICADHGITFIGPRPDVMEKVGDKTAARQLMGQAGLPLLPGTIEPVGTLGEAQDVAAEIGYPLIIKAVAGGGGTGHVDRVARRGASPGVHDHAGQRPGGVQGLARLPRAIPRGSAPHGDPDPLRPGRQRRCTWASATARSSAATRS